MDNKILATFHAYDHDDIKMLANAADASMALDNFRNWLRGHYKHGESTINTEEVWEVFHSYMGQYLL
jgi:hypothetical protein